MTALLLSLAPGCGGPSAAPAPGAVEVPPAQTAPWRAPAAGELHLSTADGVSLVADYYPAATQGRPAVLLLHMTPSGPFQRSDWPASFIEGLTAREWTVLVPDRRGAGDSGGQAEQAYRGEGGRLDVAACARRLQADGYGPLAIIGASNGTTSMIDYAAWAPSQGLPQPVALGFMTGGRYTENQTAMKELSPVPSMFTYSSAERDWSVAQQALAPADGSWRFREYPQGDHGTKLFATEPELGMELAAWLAEVLP